MNVTVCSKSVKPNSRFPYNSAIYQQMIIIFGEIKATEKYFTPVKEKIEKKIKEVAEKRR